MKQPKFTFNKRRTSARVINLHEQLRNFLAAKQTKRRSLKTIKTYHQALGQFIRWCDDNHQNKFNQDAVNGFFKWMSKEKFAWDDHPTAPTQHRHISNRGINNLIRIMRIFGNWLVGERVITDNPANEIEYLPEDNNTFKIFTDNDIKKLLAVPNCRVFTQFRDYCMMLLLLDTGMRVGELTHLRVKNFDLHINQVLIPAEISKGKIDRTIPLSRLTSKKLQEYESYTAVKPADYMWLTQFGERYYAGSFAKMLKRYGRKAGIDDARVSPHTFRNYFAVKY
jgi:integrase/recombinase XerD